MVGEDEKRAPPGFRDRVVADESVELAALAMAHGLGDPLLILDCRDPMTMLALDVVTGEAIRHAENARQDLANRLARAIGGE